MDYDIVADYSSHIENSKTLQIKGKAVLPKGWDKHREAMLKEIACLLKKRREDFFYISKCLALKTLLPNMTTISPQSLCL